MTLILAMGVVIGLVMALTGAGGGILAVPMLVFGMQLSINEAAPAGLLAVGIAALIGAVLGIREGIVRYRAALLMAGMGIVLSPAGVWLGHRISATWLNGLFAAVLLFVAWRTFTHAGNNLVEHAGGDIDTLPCVRSARDGRFVWNSLCAFALAMSGAVAGLLSGLLGVGGGFVLVPSLKGFSDLDTRSIIATSLAVTALIAASGVLFSASRSGLDWTVGLPFAGGAVLGMIGGRSVSRRVQGAHLQRGFAAVALAVAIGMVVKSIG
jgi:uncharacterized membrane protein YfcA